MPLTKTHHRPPLAKALLGFIPALAVAFIAAIGSHPLVLVPLIVANALSMAAVCHAIGFGPELSMTRTALRRGAAYLVMFTAYTALLLALVGWPLVLLAHAASLGAALVLSVALAIGVAVLWRIWPAFGLVFLWDDAFVQSPRSSWIFTAIARSLTFARHLSAEERFFGHFLPAACSLLLMAFGALALTGLYGLLPPEMRTASVLLYALVVLPAGALVLANRTLHAMLDEKAPAPRHAVPAGKEDTSAGPDAQPMAAPAEPLDEAAVEARDRALLEAVRGAQIERALALLEAGADPDVRARPGDRDQRPAIMLAALLPDIRLLRALIARGADINTAHGGLTPLLAATRDSYHGRAEAVMMLLSNGADAATADAHGNTPLHGAALSAEPGVAAMLLDAGAPINALNRNGLSPLAVAARAGNWPLAAFLLDHRAATDPARGEPALVAAAAVQDDDAAGVQMMLRHRARIDAANALGRTALICASLEGHESIVRALLKAGADVDHGDRNASTALMEAARAGANGIVQLLVDADADVNRCDTYGRNALILACQSPRAGADTVRALLGAGADPHVQAQDGRSALDHAAATGRWDLIALMNPDAPSPSTLEEETDDATGTDGNASTADDRSMRALLQALRARRWSDVASHCDTLLQASAEQRAGLFLTLAEDGEAASGARQWLLDQGLDPEARISEGTHLSAALLQGLPRTAAATRQWLAAGASAAGAGMLAVAAARCGNDAESLAVCMDMLAAGADPFGADTQHRTPLHHAAAHGQQALLDALLHMGVHPDSRDANGDTPLHAALRSDTPALPVVQSLLAHGADPEAATAQGETPLGHALELNDTELQNWLQWHGAWSLPRRRLRDEDLPAAVACGDLDAVRRLLALDLPVDAVDAQGVNALIRACGGGHAEIAECLLDAGADLAGATASGITPLAAAVNARCDRVVALLLERGADADQRVGTDTRVLTLAAAQGYPEIVERLLAAGADMHAVDASGYGALHAAAQFCFSSNDSLRARRLLDALLKHDANVDAAGTNGQTPLLLLLGAHAAPGTACDATHIGALIPVLVDAGAQINRADARGVSPLHACAMHALLAPARTLLQRGADRAAMDGFDRTAADVAQQLGYTDVALELDDRSIPSVRQTLRQPAQPGD